MAIEGNLTVTKAFDAFTGGVSQSGGKLNEAIAKASADVNDPVNLINMQKELANYNMALQTQSAIVKSVEETAKSITQKL
jgi:type III secretion apparatus needle protein